MKNYRVILRDSKRGQAADAGSSASETWQYGLVAKHEDAARVRLARRAPCLGGLEMPWAKFLSFGVAVAGLIGGPLNGEAQASVAPRLELPQAERVDAALFVPWQGVAESDSSREALQVLDVQVVTSPSEGLLLARDTGVHRNSDPTDHANTPNHVNQERWNNHTNIPGGHTNSGWDNHLNDGPARTQFHHVNAVGGDFIF